VPGRRGVRRPRAPADASSIGAAAQQQQGGSALPGRDVRECLDAERRAVLAGCRIVFSRWAYELAGRGQQPLRVEDNRFQIDQAEKLHLVCSTVTKQLGCSYVCDAASCLRSTAAQCLRRLSLLDPAWRC
jgi:hypothetical protein